MSSIPHFNLHLIKALRDFYAEYPESWNNVVVKICSMHSIDPELIKMDQEEYEEVKVSILSNLFDETKSLKPIVSNLGENNL